MTPDGFPLATIPVPTNELVTSFSSKSELRPQPVHRRQDAVRSWATWRRRATIDVSNSNTPGVIDPTNPVPGAYYRAVAQLDRDGECHFTETNAYSGNNGRAAILQRRDGDGRASTPPATPATAPTRSPTASSSAPARRSSRRRRRPKSAQKPGHADAGRQLQRHPARRQGRQDRQGRQLPRPDDLQQRPVLHQGQRQQRRQHGVLPRHHRARRARTASGCRQPARRCRPAPLAYDPTTLQANGLPSNMCILKGFPTDAGQDLDHLLPVRDLVRQRQHAVRRRRGQRHQHLRATDTYTAAAAPDHGRPAEVGLRRDDAVEARLHASGRPEPRPALHRRAATRPAPTPRPGCRGRRPPTACATSPAGSTRTARSRIWAITSTVSGGGDQGADPNKLVAITDQLSATAPGAGETFSTLRTAGFGEVLRGVSFTPGTRLATEAGTMGGWTRWAMRPTPG